uniref:Uncharacterized protein n=1 Tax=Periophthalmus magnuspinnatus TaxID=409849 RepID=A0A3B4BBM8_9GOBI
MRWHSMEKRSTPRLNTFDGLIPFDFKSDPAESNAKYLGKVTQPCVFGAHILLQWPFICGSLMMEFPMVWQWWLALGCGLFLMICNGQLIAYFTCQNDQTYSSFSIY